YSTSMEGRSADSIRQGRKAAAGLTKEVIEHMPMTQWIKATPVIALTRFGHFDEVLREPKPDAEWQFVTAMWHYARGLTYVRKQQFPLAVEESAALSKIAQDKAIEALELPNFPGASLIRVANTVLIAEVAGLRERQTPLNGETRRPRGLNDRLERLEQAV